MKKIGKLVSCIMVIVLIGCSPKTPEQIYTKAMSKLMKAEAIDMQMVTDLTWENPLKDMNIQIDSSLKATHLQSKDMEIAINNTILNLSLITMNMYYKDGYMFKEQMAKRTKEELPLEEAKKKLTIVSKLFNYGVSELVNLQAEKLDEYTNLTFSLREETVNELVRLITESITEQDLSKYNPQASNVICTILIDDEYRIQEQTISFILKINVWNKELPIDINCRMSINGYNEEVELTLPDLSQFSVEDSKQKITEL